MTMLVLGIHSGKVLCGIGTIILLSAVLLAPCYGPEARWSESTDGGVDVTLSTIRFKNGGEWHHIGTKLSSACLDLSDAVSGAGWSAWLLYSAVGALDIVCGIICLLEISSNSDYRLFWVASLLAVLLGTPGSVVLLTSFAMWAENVESDCFNNAGASLKEGFFGAVVIWIFLLPAPILQGLVAHCYSSSSASAVYMTPGGNSDPKDSGDFTPYAGGAGMDNFDEDMYEQTEDVDPESVIYDRTGAGKKTSQKDDEIVYFSPRKGHQPQWAPPPTADLPMRPEQSISTYRGADPAHEDFHTPEAHHSHHMSYSEQLSRVSGSAAAAEAAKNATKDAEAADTTQKIADAAAAADAARKDALAAETTRKTADAADSHAGNNALLDPTLYGSWQEAPDAARRDTEIKAVAAAETTRKIAEAAAAAETARKDAEALETTRKVAQAAAAADVARKEASKIADAAAAAEPARKDAEVAEIARKELFAEAAAAAEIKHKDAEAAEAAEAAHKNADAARKDAEAVAVAVEAIDATRKNAEAAAPHPTGDLPITPSQPIPAYKGADMLHIDSDTLEAHHNNHLSFREQLSRTSEVSGTAAATKHARKPAEAAKATETTRKNAEAAAAADAARKNAAVMPGAARKDAEAAEAVREL